MLRIAFIGLLLLLSMSVFAIPRVDLSSIRIEPSPTVTRVTFTLTKKTHGKIKYLTHPNRLIVEFANTYKHFEMNQAKLIGSNIISIHTEEGATGAARFVFTVKNKVTWDARYLPKDKYDRAVLQLDIFSVMPDIQKNPKQFSMNKIKNKMKIKKSLLFTVVIDAGHGGKDVGAIGRNGAQEKTIVLAIAKRLAKKMNQMPRMRAVLTRTGDYFLPLRTRLQLARKNHADLFIAIHADAHFDQRAKGASVYALSQRGATSEAARWLAAQDNYSEIGKVELNTLQDRSPLLRSVLIDLAQTATIKDSLRVGHQVLRALDNLSALHYKRVEQAPFVVLKSPDIPSILVETGFISNTADEGRLINPLYQDRIASALWQGIDRYVKSGTPVLVSNKFKFLLPITTMRI